MRRTGVISVTVTTDRDVLSAIAEQAKNSRREMRRRVQKLAFGDLSSELIRTLAKVPGRPRYPLRWTSDRQRRYVMKKLRDEGNLPYQRTGKLNRGWRVVIVSALDLEIAVENEMNYSEFVQGNWQQTMHFDTGWTQIAPIIVEFEERYQDALIEQWYDYTLKKRGK